MGHHVLSSLVRFHLAIVPGLEAFTLEILMKVVALKIGFLKDLWNWFDTFLASGPELLSRLNFLGGWMVFGISWCSSNATNPYMLIMLNILATNHDSQHKSTGSCCSS